MSPEVSIITCSLSGKELSRTINSVLAQDFTDYEIVIVAPSDNLQISELQTKHEIKNKLVIILDSKAGIYSAMNAGAQAARGKFLLFLNEGDELSKSSSLNVLREVSFGKDWAYGSILKRDISAGTTSVYHFAPYRRMLHRFGWKYVPHPSSIITKRLFDSLKGFDISEPIAADQKLFLRASQISSPGVTKEIISTFSLGGSSSRSVREAMHDARRISNAVFGYVLRSRLLDNVFWKANAKLKATLKRFVS
jgi:glycosyltransferase involved in cell wall biosynthesis